MCRRVKRRRGRRKSRRTVVVVVPLALRRRRTSSTSSTSRPSALGRRTTSSAASRTSSSLGRRASRRAASATSTASGRSATAVRPVRLVRVGSTARSSSTSSSSTTAAASCTTAALTCCALDVVPDGLCAREEDVSFGRRASALSDDEGDGRRTLMNVFMRALVRSNTSRYSLSDWATTCALVRVPSQTWTRRCSVCAHT